MTIKVRPKIRERTAHTLNQNLSVHTNPLHSEGGFQPEYVVGFSRYSTRCVQKAEQLLEGGEDAN